MFDASPTRLPFPASDQDWTDDFEGADDRAAIRRLKAKLAAQSTQLREQAGALAEARRLFEKASAAARIGLWQCRLSDERLDWSDMVYELFDLPRGAALRRGETLDCYAAPSLRALDEVRSRAIRKRAGFSLDAEIVTRKSQSRWIRITATVECDNGRAVRIFGMKQDITEEKVEADRTRRLAEVDALTGLANRGVFQTWMSELDHPRPGRDPLGALLLVDLDGFKQVNDTFGHAVGDECLKEAAARLRRVCRDADLVARIGGDEFAVLLGGRLDLSDCERVAARIVEALGRPVERFGEAFRLGASVGVAPAAGFSSTELFSQADIALYAAKAAGRNTVRTFSDALTLAVAADAGRGAAGPIAAIGS